MSALIEPAQAPPHMRPSPFARTPTSSQNPDPMQLSQASQGSFDGRVPSFASPPAHAGPTMYGMHAQPQPQNPTMSFNRSFGDVNGRPQMHMAGQPQIYTVSDFGARRREQASFVTSS
jgi:hypothetical protein